ncbi:MAG: hypothetical protein HQK54_00095 [Oligoflexales bacterium]|nr:hypothetical protein [Oligoflexales bacterium]
MKKTVYISCILLLFPILMGNAATGFSSEKVPLILNQNDYNSYQIGKHLVILEDKGKNISLEDILNHKYDSSFYQSTYDMPAWGQTESIFWAKIDFINPESEKKLLYLEHHYALTDFITVFSPKDDGTYTSLTLGDQVSFSKRPIKHRYPVFMLEIPKGKSTFYIKVNSEDLTSLPLLLWSPQAFFEFSLKDHIYLGILLGFLIVMLFYNIYLYTSHRTRDYLYYNVYVASLIFTEIGSLGVGIYLQPNSDYNWFMNRGYLLSVNICVVTSVLFALEFLSFDRKKFSNRLAYGLLKIAIIPPFINCIYFLTTSNYPASVKIAQWCVITTFPLLIIAGMMRTIQGFKPSRYYFTALLFFLLGSALAGMRGAELNFTNTIIEWGQITGDSIEVVLLSMALVYKMNLIKAETRSQIDQLNLELQRHIEDVESIVKERTDTINTILNHVDSGFLLLNREKTIEPGFSKSCERLFGRAITNYEDFADLVNLSGNARITFEAAIDQIFEDILPEEVTLKQLPQHCQIENRMLTLSAALVRKNDNSINSILVTVIDETNLRKAQKAISANNTLLHVLRHIESFKMFTRDFKEQISKMKLYISQENVTELRATLHTLKGNTASFLLNTVRDEINRIENKDQVTIKDIDRIEKTFNDFMHTHATDLEWAIKEHEQTYEVNVTGFNDLYNKSIEFNTSHDFREWLMGWLYQMQTKAVSEFLGPIRETAYRIAGKLNKAMEFELKGEDVRVNIEHMTDILNAIIHLIRNAIDHGIQTKRTNKKDLKIGTVCLSFIETEKTIIIKVEDNGQGIDVERLAAKALEKNLITSRELEKMSYQDKLDLVFIEELSTKEGKNWVSGYGMGMVAVKHAVVNRHGTIKIFSGPNEGCRVEIEVPKYHLNYSLPQNKNLKCA